jgi:predicted enzyme related to lactoylglutathione lyase
MVRTRCPTTQRSAMSTKELRRNEATGSTSVVDLDMKLEVVVIPVSDVDHAKKFYSRLGWRLDADRSAGDNFRLVQFTPPGSGSSIQFGVNLTSAAPGSAQAMPLAVSDIEDARQQLVAKGVDVSEVFHLLKEPPADFKASASALAAHNPTISATALSFPSQIRTATAGCCRKLRSGWPVASTPRRRPLRRRTTWRAHFGAPRPRTASTRSASGRPTRTGQFGTPSIWCASSLAKSCRNKRRGPPVKAAYALFAAPHPGQTGVPERAGSTV